MYTEKNIKELAISEKNMIINLFKILVLSK